MADLTTPALDARTLLLVRRAILVEAELWSTAGSELARYAVEVSSLAVDAEGLRMHRGVVDGHNAVVEALRRHLAEGANQMRAMHVMLRRISGEWSDLDTDIADDFRGLAAEVELENRRPR